MILSLVGPYSYFLKSLRISVAIASNGINTTPQFLRAIYLLLHVMARTAPIQYHDCNIVRYLLHDDTDKATRTKIVTTTSKPCKLLQPSMPLPDATMLIRMDAYTKAIGPIRRRDSPSML